MSDICDDADQRIFDARDEGIARIRDVMNRRELEPCGACHWCSSYVTSDRLFCDGECADEHAVMLQRGRL